MVAASALPSRRGNPHTAVRVRRGEETRGPLDAAAPPRARSAVPSVPAAPAVADGRRGALASNRIRHRLQPLRLRDVPHAPATHAVAVLHSVRHRLQCGELQRQQRRLLFVQTLLRVLRRRRPRQQRHRLPLDDGVLDRERVAPLR